MRMVLPQFDLTRSNFFQYQKLVYKIEKRFGKEMR